MANRFLTPQMIAPKAILSVQNQTVFGNRIDYGYEDMFNKMTKIGHSTAINRQLLANVVKNNMAYTSAAQSAIYETSVNLVMSDTLTSCLNIGDMNAALIMSLDDFADRHMKSVTSQFANKYDLGIHDMCVNAGKGGAYDSTAGFIPTIPGTVWDASTSGNALTNATAGSIPTVYRGVAGWVVGAYGTALNREAIAEAKVYLLNAGCPDDGDIYGILTPRHNSQLSLANITLFNAQKEIADIYFKGYVGNFMGVELATSANCASHTNGAAATIAVTSATSNGLSTGWADTATLTVTALSGAVKAGDAFTAEVYAVNPLSKQNTGILQQFTVINDAALGATSIEVYPAPIYSGPYQNVTGTLASTTLTLIGGTTGVTASGAESIVFHKKAIVAAFVTLLGASDKETHFEKDNDVVKMGLRYTNFFDKTGAAPGSNGVPGWVTRIDSGYGHRIVRGEWVVRIRGGIPA